MILVTGSTGLLGSHLMYKLLSSGEKVRALKRKQSNIENIKKTFSYYSGDYEKLFKNIEWAEGDVLDIVSLEDAMEDVEYVYHCAGLVSFAPDDKEKLFKINVKGTANVVNTALKYNIKKLCHVSSIASLGRDGTKKIITEKSVWNDSANNTNYAVSKYNGELEVWRGIQEGLKAVIVNPSIILGAGNWDKGSSQLFLSIYKGQKYYLEGANSYVDVRDLVDIMHLLMKSDIENERFIISSENVSYYDLFNMIAKSLGKKTHFRKANFFIAELAWRIEKLKCKITNSQPLITKETIRTAKGSHYYSNEKIKKALDYNFISINKSVEDICKILLKDK